MEPKTYTAIVQGNAKIVAVVREYSDGEIEIVDVIEFVEIVEVDDVRIKD